MTIEKSYRSVYIYTYVCIYMVAIKLTYSPVLALIKRNSSNSFSLLDSEIWGSYECSTCLQVLIRSLKCIHSFIS